MFHHRTYETTEFEAGDCKWKLIFYPNGLDNGSNSDHVSVYLAVADSTSLCWEVNAVFSIFLHNRKSDNFVYKQGGMRRFHALNRCWGFSKFISKKSLMDPSNGYVVQDTCTSGAEVFVVKNQVVIGRLIMPKAEMPYKRRWQFPTFSRLPDKWVSESFYAGQHQWNLEIYPRAEGKGKDHCVSLYLRLTELKHPSKSVHVSYKLQINDQINGKHCSQILNKWFESCSEWGLPEFMPIKYMNDPGTGFLVDDCCVVEIEITVID